MQATEEFGSERALGTRLSVTRVADEPTTLGGLAAAAILGVPTAVLLGALVAQLASATVWALLTFVVAWPVAAWLLGREARHAVNVATRGCVLGAVLWMLLIVSEEPVAQAAGDGPVHQSVAAPFVSWLLGLAAPMLWVCLFGAAAGLALMRRPGSRHLAG